MEKIHLIPTDKPSRLVLDTVNKNLFLTTTKDFGTKIMQFQNIYITSDEEIKNGEWIYDIKLKQIDKYSDTWCKLAKQNARKIIITTDQDLIKDGVQKIDDTFLEWFVKNPSCERVELVNYLVRISNFDWKTEYKIIIPQEELCSFCKGTGQIVSSTTISGFKTCDCINIPQEEPGQELLPDFKITKNIFDFVTDLSDTNKEEPKHITVKEPCSLCDGTGETTFSGTYTTQRKCDLCNGEKYWNKKILVDQPKQERVEEAANNFAKLLGNKHETIFALEENAFIEGAKWQAERMYSEEEVLELVLSRPGPYLTDEEIKEWFEQFKKK
jgi:hypothetical protein